MSFNDLRMNPEYPYLQAQLESRRHESETLIRVATREGRAEHPAVQIARDNLTLIERLTNEYADRLKVVRGVL